MSPQLIARIAVPVVVLAVLVALPWGWLLTTYMPHNHCYGGQPAILVPWIIGDVATFAAYVAIPAQLFRMCRRGTLPPMFAITFAAFIVLCGVGHLLDALAQAWWPAYALRAYWGLGTAIASIATAGMLQWGSEQMIQRDQQRQRERDDAVASMRTLGRQLAALQEGLDQEVTNGP